MSKLNVEKIKQLNSDPGFSPIISAIEMRERDRGTTDIRQFYNTMMDKFVAEGQEKPAVSLDQTVIYYRELAEAGFGQFIEGGRGSAARFKWGYKIKTVGPALRDPDNMAGNVIRIHGFRIRAKTTDEASVETTSEVHVSDLAQAVADHQAAKARPKREKKVAKARPPKVQASKVATPKVEAMPAPVQSSAVLTLSPTGVHFDVSAHIDALTAIRLTKLIQSMAS